MVTFHISSNEFPIWSFNLANIPENPSGFCDGSKNASISSLDPTIEDNNTGPGTNTDPYSVDADEHAPNSDELNLPAQSSILSKSRSASHDKSDNSSILSGDPSDQNDRTNAESLSNVKNISTDESNLLLTPLAKNQLLPRGIGTMVNHPVRNTNKRLVTSTTNNQNSLDKNSEKSYSEDFRFLFGTDGCKSVQNSATQTNRKCVVIAGHRFVLGMQDAQRRNWNWPYWSESCHGKRRKHVDTVQLDIHSTQQGPTKITDVTYYRIFHLCKLQNIFLRFSHIWRYQFHNLNKSWTTVHSIYSCRMTTNSSPSSSTDTLVFKIRSLISYLPIKLINRTKVKRKSNNEPYFHT